MEKVISGVYTGLYILFLCSFTVLALLSSREELPAYARDPPWRRPFRRMALWLIGKLEARRNRRRRQGKDLLIPGEEGVRNDLRILYPSMKAAREEILYRMDKFERLLLLIFACVLLAGAMHVRSFTSGLLQEDGSVTREESGGGDRKLTVVALPDPVKAEEQEAAEKDEKTKDYGTYTITVHARQLTRKEAQAGAQEILRQFPDILLGDNQSPDQIRSPLVMPDTAMIQPFTLSWESSRYAVLDTDGSIFNEDYAQEQAEDVELTAPEKGTIHGIVTSVIFKGMHYEITIESGRNEMVARSVHAARPGDQVGICLEPDSIHIMIAEDHTNYFTADINESHRLEYNGHVLDTSVTKIIKGSKRQDDGTIIDANGEVIDPRRTRIVISIQPQDIRMTDHVADGLVEGYISNLIYKGDHYSYVIHTDLEQDFIVDDEYLWNMDDHVGLIMPIEKMSFAVKK